jgi:uncharacterized protein YbcI
MTAPNDRGKMLLGVTNAIVGSTASSTVATRARTIMQNDYLVCFLEDIYTKAERTLIEAGNFEEVARSRNAFQGAMEERFRAAVETLTGREVAGFLSQVRTDPDLAVEAFWLVPDGRPS